MSTGTFSSAARGEASRDGGQFIELIDGDRLVELFEKLEFGLESKTVFEIQRGFFDKYRDRR